MSDGIDTGNHSDMGLGKIGRSVVVLRTGLSGTAAQGV